MKRKTLYQQLKPEVKGRLHSQDEEYENTINKIIASLKSKYFWSDLTIEEARSVEIFSETISDTVFEFKWGEKILKDEKS